MPLISRLAVSSAKAFGFTSGGIPAITYLVVAGGGGAAGWINGSQAGASGGAGGVLTATSKLFKAGVTYTITIGQGGPSSYGGSGTNGDNTTLIGTGVSITSIGGGKGGANGVAGGNGGSGGGGGAASGAGGTGTPGQGYNGGSGSGSTGGGYGGGAGGAATPSSGGPGPGISNPISGSTAGYNPGSGTYGLAGGGQTSPYGTVDQYGAGGNATNAAANSGSGGGGGGVYPGSNVNINGAGGSGFVVISYPKSYKAATTTGSPTVITTATNRIYQFTSSGTIVF